ncbi:hypothetical protein LTR56_008559 [Elasticomyces elasticus]|nr:hypothetical protein LTR56_008559 [Elasticomyces elasticus]KAK3653310.1 hypothetical protein LTR22_011270 [Elasticomyces elasticus]KAK4918244.1 hypothetical protein LTR49_013943 [Elasticomyces elasticus]KAK5758369.1 hypothetical protein LTS12_011542 [Elasticomyces elasticus]
MSSEEAEAIFPYIDQTLRVFSCKVPRNYVHELERQVEKMTKQLQDLQKQLDEHPASPTRSSLAGISPTAVQPVSDGSPSQLHDLVRSVKNVVVEPSRQPRFLGQSSGITLAKMVMAAVRVDALTAPLFPEQRSVDTPPTASAAEASLPPRHAADHLVQVYFQYRTPHLPIVGRAQAEKAVTNAYQHLESGVGSNHTLEEDVFTTYMVFAIALYDVPNPSGGRPSQSEGCFQSAVSWVHNVITYSESDLSTLRAVLLLAQFVALCPSRGSLWHLAGFALRLCVDIGLHWETNEQALSLDPEVLYDRRCLWYSTYHFDRVLCITLGRPFGIIDESVRVPLPVVSEVPRTSDPPGCHAFDTHHQEAHNQLFELARLESEIKHVLHSQTWEINIAYPRVDYLTWLLDIEPRLQRWLDAIPHLSQVHPQSIFAYQAYWDMVYSKATLLIHRPHSIAQHPSTGSMFMAFDASCKLIASIKTLQREGKIDIQWRSVHDLFMAGLGVIYILWQSKEIRSQRSVSSSISALHICASTLSALSESFAGAAGCRDAFETLSTATVDWLLTYDAEQERQNRLVLEKQVEDLLQQLRPTREGPVTNHVDSNVDHMSHMLSGDNFAFSEMLSSTAQWPDPQNMGFGDMDEFSVNGTAYGADWWQ